MRIHWIKAGFWLLVVLSQLGLPMANAREVDGLYQARVPVKGQSREERLDVYPEALAQVVVKLSGNRNVPDLPQLADFISQAVALVQQFYYEELPTDQVLVEEGYTRMLVVSFDGNAISQALIGAEVPLWGHTRSEVLLLLAVEDRGARYLVAANTLAELESSLNDQAARRGLPVILPLMDLEDQVKLSFADVWGDFRHSLIQASRRYATDAILVGRMIRTQEGMWQTRWSLHQTAGSGADSEYWYSETNTQKDALAEGVNGTADRIAKRYAQLFSDATADSVLLMVTDVNNLTGYAKAMKYLASQDIVTAVEVSRVVADRVLFRLTIRGNQTGLEQTISLGNTLRPVQESMTADQDEPAFGKAYVYRLLP